MKAVVIDHCCKAEDLKVSQLPVPAARAGWVVVRIHAAGLNHSEVVLRLYEADEDYIHTPIVPGIECAGEVADPSDTDLRRGERVVALMGGMGRSFDGSYEEYALLPRDHVFRAPEGLTWTQLAAVPETYFTAYGSLTEGLHLRKGDVLLVRGATSTVGQAAVQLGAAMGADVIATCRREASFEKLWDIGARYCAVDDEHLARHTFQKQPDKVLELIGPKTLRDSLQTVRYGGIVCNTGILGNVMAVESFEPIKYIPNGVFLTSFYSNYPTQLVMNQIFSLLQTHRLRPLLSRVFKIDDIVAAHTLLERGGAGGKMVLDMD